MKKIIFLEKKACLLNKKHDFHCLCEELRGVTKEYYNLNKNKVEVIYISDEKYLSKILELSEEDIKIATTEEIYNKCFYGTKEGVCYLYNTDSNSFLDIDDILLLESIISKEKSKNVLKRMIGIGDGEYPISNIVIQILKKINFIETCKKCFLKLVVGKELNMEEISSLEDPLKEYLMNDTEIIITQEIRSEIKNKIYFSLLGE